MSQPPELEPDVVATNPPFRRGGGPGSVTVNKVPRRLNVFYITEDELESLYTSGNLKTLDFGLFSLSIGVFIAVVGTLLTVDIQSPTIAAIYWAALFVSVLASLFFGFRAVIEWRSAARRLSDIKRVATSGGAA